MPSKPEATSTAEIDRLLRLLGEQVARHEMLRTCIARQREAIRRADITAIREVCEQEHQVARAIGDAEKLRLALVGRITARVQPGAQRPLSLLEIAALTDGATRSALEEVSCRLRELIESLRRESAIVRSAASALSDHVGGILQKVYGALAGSGVYEQRGRLALGSQVEHCVDLKS